jgi:nicotinate-nucleotide adenylyltransferase
MGGTFDPIHYGHLFAAEEARIDMSLDRVIFVPTGAPPHKRREGMASAEERYEMTLLATNDNSFFDVTRIETDRIGNSYTVDTLRRMGETYPGAELFLIVGEDAVHDIPTWKSPAEIISLSSLIVVSRPGFSHDKIDELPEMIREKALVLRTPLLDISATDIRDRIASGRGVGYLLPHPVMRYIVRRGLYLIPKINQLDGGMK